MPLPPPPPRSPASAEPELAEQLGRLLHGDLSRVHERVAQLVRTRSRPLLLPLPLDAPSAEAPGPDLTP